ncbi:right-handed parallel beta-helix repeat-containing protein [Alteromonadaceae bacterium BrNp21-10]|nr:right-handed parallel beta-helix repeat-containing protein [Alteromonadaceae bacterium BrNp21-10]
MNRRQFLRFSTNALTTSMLLSTVSNVASATTVINHPNTIFLQTPTDSIATNLQQAFESAYQLWLFDPQGRRPVISVPAGTFYIDEIANNDRGDYPFHLPPTFKLIGAGKTQTRIINRTQSLPAQYRLLYTRPQSRLDILNECDASDGSCISNAMLAHGAATNIEIADLALQDFDYAIGLRDAQQCHIHDCIFDGSLVAIQLVTGDTFGNNAHLIENCDFNATQSNGNDLRFCLRFEAPFSNVWTTTETGVPSLAECEALGGSELDYNATYQTCDVANDTLLQEYLNSMFGIEATSDISNSQCEVTGCEFRHAAYSAIEFAGKLNQHNQVRYNSFYDCCGTAIEFDKGASHNTASANIISGMKPSTAFAPSIPYVFQAAIQEQEGSHTADVRMKSLISELGYDDPNHINYRGDDIFYRASSLPMGNQISANQFDISRSYWLSEYESNSSKAAKLPDVYPSIKIRKPLDTNVTDNIEFVSNAQLHVTNTQIMGQSLIIYPDDELRDNRGGAQVNGNQFHGALFIVGTEAAPKSTMPLTITYNNFGVAGNAQRGGINCNYAKAQHIELSDNQFACATNASSSVIQKIDIGDFQCLNNQFLLPTANSFYLRSLTADSNRSNQTSLIGNTFEGGVSLSIQDWSDNSWQSDTDTTLCNDSLNFSQNTIHNLAGASKVVGVTIWYRNLTLNSNYFDHCENKIYQLYGLSDTLQQDGLNNLNLASNSQNRAYSRNYRNNSGHYITSTFWA